MAPAVLVSSFSVRGSGGLRRVVLDIFDVTGRSVATLFDGELMPGNYTVVWSGTGRGDRPLSSGVYMARLRMGETAQTAPLVMIN